MAMVSEAEILQLVAERETMRQARRFPESDALRDRLRSMGVEIYDKERIWKSQDGRRGVLFTAGPQDCMLNDEQIQSLIIQREEARTSKDWRTADQIRDQLRNNGVELDDKVRIWRTSTGRQGSFGGGHSNLPPTVLPSESDLALSGQSLSEADIRNLVSERERNRAAQDFTAADEVRRHLAQHGVELFDAERIWRHRNGQQGIIVTGGAQIVQCSIADEEISHHIRLREDARIRKDWPAADGIRDQLRQHGVELLDKDEKWRSSDGRRGGYRDARLSNACGGMTQVHQPSMQAAQQDQPHEIPTHSIAPGSAGPLEDATLQALLAGYEQARAGHPLGGCSPQEAADAIQQDLLQHGVEVWPEQCMWCSADGRQGKLGKAPAAQNQFHQPGMLGGGFTSQHQQQQQHQPQQTPQRQMMSWDAVAGPRSQQPQPTVTAPRLRSSPGAGTADLNADLAAAFAIAGMNPPHS